MSRITTYAALTAARLDDVFPVVDVHDTSMAATGTTKKITAASLASGVSIVAYGAFLDGVSDSTTAIQACMNAAAPFGAPVLIPAGTEFRASQLTWNTGQVIQGVYCGTYPGEDTIPTASVLVRLAGTNLDLIVVPDGVNYGRIADVAINGNKGNNTAGAGFRIADGAAGQETQIIIERCFFHDNPDSNVYLGHSRRANKVLNGVFSYSANGDGITDAGSDNTLAGNICGSNGRGGIVVGTTVTQNWAAAASPFPSDVSHVISNDIYGNVVGVAIAASSTNCLVLGNGIDRNTKQGITVYNGASNTIQNNSLHSNGTLTHNTYAHIDVGSGTTQVGINNNNFGPLDAGVSNVASFCVQHNAGTGVITGNIGNTDPTSTVGGLINATSNTIPYVAVSKAGALIQGSGNDVLSLKNSSGGLLTKVTQGGTFVHSGGAFQLGGHYVGLVALPGVANGSNCTGAAISSNSSDIGGIVSATMIASPAAGSLMVVTFHAAFTNTPAVVLTPSNGFAAQITTYVTVTSTGFTISAATTPPAAVNSQAVSWDYLVIGQNA